MELFRRIYDPDRLDFSMMPGPVAYKGNQCLFFISRSDFERMQSLNINNLRSMIGTKGKLYSLGEEKYYDGKIDNMFYSAGELVFNVELPSHGGGYLIHLNNVCPNSKELLRLR